MKFKRAISYVDKDGRWIVQFNDDELENLLNKFQPKKKTSLAARAKKIFAYCIVISKKFLYLHRI
jgi:hypothetical protein